MTDWRSGEETTVALGHLVGTARRLHGVLGAAALTSGLPRVTVLLDEWSLFFSDHAAWLFDRLPLRDGLEREAFVSPGPFSDVLSALEDCSQVGDEVGVVVGFVEVVLPALQANVAAVRTGCSEAGERNLKRILGFFEVDLTGIEEDGSELVRILTTDATHRARAAEVLASFPSVK